MYSPRTKLKVPTDFRFPYERIYDIQLQFMKSLFTVIEEKKIGIFESPTGTGKSLTLTCASLCWLEQHEALVRQELHDRILEVKKDLSKLEDESERSKDWLTINHIVIGQRDELNSLQRLHDLLEVHEKRLIELRQNRRRSKVQLPVQGIQTKTDEISALVQVEECLVDEQESESTDLEDSSNDINKQSYRGVKIFFCSRTHSQLAQVLREVKQTKYGKSIRCVSLASRQQFCINPQVRGMSNVASMNECCLDMTRTKKTMTTSSTNNGTLLKNRTPTATKCPYKSVATIQELNESILCDIQDIEEIVEEAQKIKACAYYASRAAAQSAQLIMLPYQLLLHRRTRLQSGIDLRGAVVIIDEAHNLLDTIAQLYSCKLTLQQLISLRDQIDAYKQQYAIRFSAANLLRINQLLFITKRLIDMLQQSIKHKRTRILRTYELTAEGEFYNIDLLQLLEFCERTRFAQKLQGYAQRVNVKSQPPQGASSARKSNISTVHLLQQLQQDQEKKKKNKVDFLPRSGPLSDAKSLNVQDVVSVRPLLAFLEALTENTDDGRVLLCLDLEVTHSSSFKYLLLNPGSRFEDILREARAIVIAGGTMQPTNELMHQLFHTCPERVTQHFYDHVVAPDAVLPLIVTCGPTGQRLCFNYAKRNSEVMMSELCRCLLNLCSVLPSGVVCFLPSYEYLDIIYKHLQKSGILARLSSKKQVLCESKNMQNVEKLLIDYAQAIKNNSGGALLLSVVGGKLSEGLNFSDDLGRGIIVVGLPYPNRQSVELLERLKYLDSVLGNDAGNEYYENLCMKAVNQCIGRSVRHIADYSCVCLLDERYATERIRNKLPKWILRSLQLVKLEQNFGSLQASIAKFFKQKIV